MLSTVEAAVLSMAIAHIRGGKEKSFCLVRGRQARQQYQHVTDFIAAARYLDKQTSHPMIASSPRAPPPVEMPDGAVAKWHR